MVYVLCRDHSHTTFSAEKRQQNVNIEPVYQSVLICPQSGHIQAQGTNFPFTLLYNRCIFYVRSECLQSMCLMSIELYTTLRYDKVNPSIN